MKQEHDIISNAAGNSFEEKKVIQSNARRLLKEAKMQDKGKIPVRVDTKTIIFVEKGHDVKKAIARFKKKTGYG